MSELKSSLAPLQLTPIGMVRTSFSEKFGVPRQAMMIARAQGIIKLSKDRRFEIALRDLASFSHIWLIYHFHKIGNRPWRAAVDTPRLDAEGMMGVFATRSPHRPNPIGMSAVKLESIDLTPDDGIEIHISGVDILDGTPVLDIKPYLPYADRIDEANSGWASSSIEKYPVTYSEQASRLIESDNERGELYFGELLQEILEFDPRPTSQRRAKNIFVAESDGSKFAFRLLGRDIHWHIHQGGILVDKIIELNPAGPCGSHDQEIQRNF
jgi:tRNA-Thr(GGU) m(6)t(6)A37 methyltransferase TsaA